MNAVLAEGLEDIRDAAVFEQRRDHAAKALFGEAMSRLKLAETILALVAELKPMLEAPLMGWARGNLDDMEAQLAGLIHPGFLRDTPADALAQYPRYLKAMILRTERAKRDPPRDQARMLELHPFLDALRDGEAQGLRERPQWQALRWDLEELRVSLFAQELGARTGISAKKLAQRGRGIGLFPFLAVVQHVDAALAEATELALQHAGDWLVAAEIEEAPVLHDHFLASVLACLLADGGHGRGGGRLDLALQPAVERGQVRRIQLVQPGGLALGGRHLLLQVAFHHALGQRRRRYGQQQRGAGEHSWTEVWNDRGHGGTLLGLPASVAACPHARRWWPRRLSLNGAGASVGASVLPARCCEPRFRPRPGCLVEPSLGSGAARSAAPGPARALGCPGVRPPDARQLVGAG
ncbi:hypothetical protein G6F68_010349 [Rhizopus microsporus]|nr:hypothetical protein G6F68_010349 [Rhizopus microsporus]